MPRNATHNQIPQLSQEEPTSNLLPVVDWVFECVERVQPRRGWLITSNSDVVTIRQDGNVIKIPAAQFTEFLATLYRIGG